MGAVMNTDKVKELHKLVTKADKTLLTVWQKCDQAVDINGKPVCREEHEWARIIVRAQMELKKIQTQLENTLTGGNNE